MISAKTYNLKGEALKDTELVAELFGVKVKPSLLAQAIRVYLSNQRRSPAKTKTRGMVSKTTAKMYKQKGTGRARHGSWAAPIFVGGGIAHGPTGEQNYRLEMSTPMRRLAFLGALSAKAAKGEIQIVSGADEATGKTKETAAMWLKVNQGGKALVLSTATLDKFNKSVRNIDMIQVAKTANVNTYDVLSHRQLVIVKEALAELKKQYVD